MHRKVVASGLLAHLRRSGLMLSNRHLSNKHRDEKETLVRLIFVSPQHEISHHGARAGHSISRDNCDFYVRYRMLSRFAERCRENRADPALFSRPWSPGSRQL